MGYKSKPLSVQNIDTLFDRGGEKYNFYFHRDRVFYCRFVLLDVMQSHREDLAKLALSITRKNLLSFGICFGKFSKSRKFRLHITALPYLSPYAKYRIWLKSSAEQQFLYGRHILKSGLARVSEDMPQYAGVIVLSADNVPLVIHPIIFP